MKATPRVVLWLGVLLLVSTPRLARAGDMRFEQGSLIIPMQRAYQTPCGVVAAYGLVYRLLQQGVTVYWAVKPTKTSHYRCKNTSDVPAYLDGCDFEVSKASGQPVSLLLNSSGNFTDTLSTFSTLDNPNNTGQAAFPVNASVRRLRYMGGPFIIDATSASRAVELLRTHPDFVLFRGAEGTPTCSPGARRHVRVHRANNAFVAPIARVINQVPPPLALVDGGAVNVLQEYLTNAGLNFPGAGGTFENHGQIYDVLQDNGDLHSTAAHPFGKLNYAPDPTKPSKTYYKVLWAPHWGGRVNTAVVADGLNDLQSALKNIAHFVDLGNSIFAECHAIETYEDHVAGNGYSRFLAPDGMAFNGVGNGFASNGQECSDPGRVGDCYTFSNYADLFSQKGDFKVAITGGSVHTFKPAAGRSYGIGTQRLMSTRSSDASKTDWELYALRQKDNNRRKGSVLYLGGHSFSDSAGGTRFVLNTLLNLDYRPEPTELSRSEPVMDVTYRADGTVDTLRVLSGTLLDLPPSALFPERMSFRPEQAADWIFPYAEGRFRSIPASAIGPSRQSFSQGAEWEASERMPAPGARTLFTVLGTNEQGLRRVPFTLAQLSAGCQDHSDTGRLSTVCDLQEALALDRNAAGTSWIDTDEDGLVDASVTAAALAQLNHMSQHFLQRVRGLCVAHDTTDGTAVDTMSPAASDCDNTEFGVVQAALGGLDHASAAVVGRSRYIPTERPVVAYIGGYDGQLHAIYLRGTQPGFTPPPPGTELWAFIPKGQLSRLRTNDARVDVSPVVADVFADYEDADGNGVLSASERTTGRFRWRTLLVSGSGRLGGELFALDVTDPLNPVVLWDVTASSDNRDSPVPQLNTAFTWSERAGQPSPDYLDLGSATRTGPYNYADLGDSLEMNLVAVRRGNRPAFQLIVATNGAGSGAQQLQVFGIDAGTGRKLWQWERNYADTTSNSVPGGTSTLDTDGDGLKDRVYVGDMEGSVWELSIQTGVNLNYFQDEAQAYASYPLFSTRNDLHPVSTVPAVMRLPSPLGTGLFSSFGVGAAAAGRLALVFGTGGVDWVLARSPQVRGRVYVVAVSPEDLRLREQLTYDKVRPLASGLPAELALRGTARPGATVHLELEERERMVGSPKLIGSRIVLTTAYGNTESDALNTDMAGRTHRLDLSLPTGQQVISTAGKAAAGALVLPDGSVVTQSLRGLLRTPGAVEVPAVGLSGKRTPVRIGAWLDPGRATAE